MPTLRHILGNVVSVPMTMISLSLKKLIYPRNLFFRGINRFSPNVVIATDWRSKIQFGNRVSIHSGSRLTSNSGGELTVGARVSFNVGCVVTCKNKITIGNNVAFGPYVLVFDHDHLMNREHGAQSDDFSFGEIVIGDNCWIGAGSIILKGTRIGNGCVIAAGSVVKGVIPDGTTLIQKRENTLKGIELYG